MPEPMVVSETLREEFETVRASGSCNMFDRRCVLQMAQFMELDVLSAVAEDRKLYGSLIEHFAIHGYSKEGV